MAGPAGPSEPHPVWGSFSVASNLQAGFGGLRLGESSPSFLALWPRRATPSVNRRGWV